MNEDLIVILAVWVWCLLLLAGARTWDVQARWATNRAENRLRRRRSQQPRYSLSGRRLLNK